MLFVFFNFLRKNGAVVIDIQRRQTQVLFRKHMEDKGVFLNLNAPLKESRHFPYIVTLHVVGGHTVPLSF